MSIDEHTKLRSAIRSFFSCYLFFFLFLDAVRKRANDQSSKITAHEKDAKHDITESNVE